jgi:hypothetical protein
MNLLDEALMDSESARSAEPLEALIPWLRIQLHEWELLGVRSDSEDVRAVKHWINVLEHDVRALIKSARVYYTRYAQDEADDDGPTNTGCTVQQSQDARALRDALKAVFN